MSSVHSDIQRLEADVIEAEKMIVEAKQEQHRLISIHNAEFPKDPIAFGYPTIARAVLLDRGDWQSLAAGITQGVSPGSAPLKESPREIVEIYVKHGHAAIAAMITAEDHVRHEQQLGARIACARRDELPKLIADETDTEKKESLEKEYREFTTRPTRAR